MRNILIRQLNLHKDHSLWNMRHFEAAKGHRATNYLCLQNNACSIVIGGLKEETKEQIIKFR